MNNKIFMGLRLPPPVHGESLMSTYILGCPTFRERFSISYIDIKAAEKIDDFNKFSVKKIANIFATYFKFVYKLIFFKPQVVYIAISPIGISFYKDAFLIMAAKLLRKKVVLHLHGKGIDYSISKHSINTKLYPIILKNTYCICLSNALIFLLQD